MRKGSGFTLIELLIVMLILGILLGVTAMYLTDMVVGSRQRAMASEKQVVQTAIDAYNTLNVAGEGSAAVPAEGTWTQLAKDDGLSPPYFNKYLMRETKFYYKWDADGENLDGDVDGVD